MPQIFPSTSDCRTEECNTSVTRWTSEDARYCDSCRAEFGRRKGYRLFDHTNGPGPGDELANRLSDGFAIIYADQDV